jgi:hypothetical protein
VVADGAADAAAASAVGGGERRQGRARDSRRRLCFPAGLRDTGPPIRMRDPR